MDTKVLPEVQQELTEPDGLAHYVRIKALIEGGEIVALCGKKYIPTVFGAAVLDLEICLSCVELMAMIISMDKAV